MDGTQGVNEAQCNEFLDAIPEYLSWLELAKIPEAGSAPHHAHRHRHPGALRPAE